jgi:FkbM family methyltransferase
LDVGANIGCTALLLATRCASVIAFEPGPQTCAFLRQNVSRAGLENVTVENLALGAADTNGRLVASETNRSGAFVTEFAAPAGHTLDEVTIVRGDTYLERAGIAHVDLIKIDTEGYEREVLEGLRNTVANARTVVCLELNHWCLNAFRRTSVPDFLDFLRGFFPVLYAVGEDDLRDLHDADDAYFVMHEHIVHMRYPSIIGAFDAARLERLFDVFRRSEAERQHARQVAALVTQLDDLKATVERSEQRNAELELALSALKHSKSWRITAPLRSIRARVP